VLIIYAAAPGQTASDGDGVNSPFATALARRLPQADLPVQLLGGVVRDDVLAATGGQQRPFVSASITGTPIYLQPKVAAKERRPPSTPSAQPAPPQLAPTPTLPSAAIAKALNDGKTAEAASRYAEARSLYAKACDAGDMEACRLLGSMYEDGRGGGVDFAKALSLYSQSCEGGDAFSCYGAGSMYENGRSVAADGVRARSYYRRSCDAGNSLYNAVGCSGLATLTAKGIGGSQDLIRARELFEKSCTIGFAVGCNGLAIMVSGGLGGPQDAARARALYKQACATGYQPACSAK
jgi:TPR repeat protein